MYHGIMFPDPTSPWGKRASKVMKGFNPFLKKGLGIPACCPFPAVGSSGHSHQLSKQRNQEGRPESGTRRGPSLSPVLQGQSLGNAPGEGSRVCTYSRC